MCSVHNSHLWFSSASSTIATTATATTTSTTETAVESICGRIDAKCWCDQIAAYAHTRDQQTALSFSTDFRSIGSDHFRSTADHRRVFAFTSMLVRSVRVRIVCVCFLLRKLKKKN
jgi:hypothetical protein